MLPVRSRYVVLFLAGVVTAAAGSLVVLRQHDSRLRDRMERYESDCRTAVRDGHWEELVATARKWANRQPESPDPWLFLAEGHLQLSRPEDSIEALDEVPRDHPKAIPAIIKKAEIEFDLLNRPLAAEQTSQELLELEPRVVEVRSRLIFFYALTLQRVQLIEQIREAIRYGSEPPEAYVYLLLCDHLYFTNGPELNSKWLQGTPDAEVFEVAAAVQFDEVMQRLENQTEATLQTRQTSRKKLEQLLERYPENTVLLRYFLHLYAEESRVRDVARILAMVPPEAGTDSVFWRFQGWYHAALDNLQRAEQAYRKSLELTATDWRSWQGLSGVLRRQSHLEEAERCQKIALTGKELRQELMRLPTADDVTDHQLDRISRYAAACGDAELAEHLQYRLQQRGYRR